jgi:hypothetical protein
MAAARTWLVQHKACLQRHARSATTEPYVFCRVLEMNSMHNMLYYFHSPSYQLLGAETREREEKGEGKS